MIKTKWINKELAIKEVILLYNKYRKENNYSGINKRQISNLVETILGTYGDKYYNKYIKNYSHMTMKAYNKFVYDIIKEIEYQDNQEIINEKIKKRYKELKQKGLI